MREDMKFPTYTIHTNHHYQSVARGFLIHFFPLELACSITTLSFTFISTLSGTHYELLGIFAEHISHKAYILLHPLL